MTTSFAYSRPINLITLSIPLPQTLQTVPTYIQYNAHRAQTNTLHLRLSNYLFNPVQETHEQHLFKHSILSESVQVGSAHLFLSCCRVIVFAGQIWNLIEGRNAGYVGDGAFLHYVHIDEYVSSAAVMCVGQVTHHVRGMCTGCLLLGRISIVDVSVKG